MLLFSSRVKPRVAASSPLRTGKSWPFGSTSLRTSLLVCSQSESAVFKKVAMPARATLGSGTLSLPINFGWAGKDINTNDPVELALAGRLQMSALAHVAGFTSRAYVGPWHAFVS